MKILTVAHPHDEMNVIFIRYYDRAWFRHAAVHLKQPRLGRFRLTGKILGRLHSTRVVNSNGRLLLKTLESSFKELVIVSRNDDREVNFRQRSDQRRWLLIC